MSPADDYRLFFALWPEEPLREQIEQRTRAAVAASGGRPIPPLNYHITLLFLGNVGSQMLQQAHAVAESLSNPAFELSLDRVQTPARAHVTWLAGQPAPPALNGLVARLRATGLASGIEHAFEPHVTLARDPIRRPPTLTIEPLTWAARDFVLVRSQLGAAGSQYTVIGRWALL
jgi:RNA 2',3'-cyclic 3'-phosphodiesterase